MLMKGIQKGGASQMFVWVAKTLAANGHEVVAMTYLSNKDIVMPDTVKWIRADLRKRGPLSRITAIRREIKRAQADVCISFLLDANVFNVLACQRLKTKAVICERSDPFKPGYWKIKLLKPIFRYASGAVFQIPRVADFYDNISAPTAVIPNPAFMPPRCEKEIPYNERQNVICLTGRFDLAQKRNDVLIKAFAAFYKVHPEYTLYYYCRSGGDEVAIKEMVRKEGLEKAFLFPGLTSNPYDVLRQSKMFVITSDFEGMPNSLIEAMSVGQPCVSTDCSPGGAAFLIRDHQNGFLVPRGDAGAVASKMIYLAEHPDEAESMGKEAAKIVEELSEERVGFLWLQYLARLVS